MYSFSYLFYVKLSTQTFALGNVFIGTIGQK